MARRKPKQAAVVIRKGTTVNHFSGDQRTDGFAHNGFKAADKGAPR